MSEFDVSTLMITCGTRSVSFVIISLNATTISYIHSKKAKL